MSDTTNTAESGASAPAPAVVPKSDAEAALQSQAAPEASAEPTAEQKAAAEKAEADKREAEEKKRNRTRDYISRIQNENAEMRRRLADMEARSQPRTQPASPTSHAQGDHRPTLEEHGYDFNAWQRADTEWVDRQAERRAAELFDQRARAAREQEVLGTYSQRAAEFAEQHDDFDIVVGAMPPLPMEMQAAIMGQPNGPAIAYHLASNPVELAQFAAMPPHFAEWAVGQIAARLSAAPAASQPTNVAPPAAPAPTRPVTQAPPPPPMVGGRSATETPATKLTDDEWYAKDRERRRKR